MRKGKRFKPQHIRLSRKVFEEFKCLKDKGYDMGDLRGLLDVCYKIRFSALCNFLEKRAGGLVQLNKEFEYWEDKYREWKDK